jgi:septation ring formation regulator EzrA
MGGTLLVIGIVVVVLAAVIIAYYRVKRASKAQKPESKRDNNPPESTPDTNAGRIAVRVEGSSQDHLRSWRRDQIVPLSLVQQVYPKVVVTGARREFWQ